MKMKDPNYFGRPQYASSKSTGKGNDGAEKPRRKFMEPLQAGYGRAGKVLRGKSEVNRRNPPSRAGGPRLIKSKKGFKGAGVKKNRNNPFKTVARLASNV